MSGRFVVLLGAAALLAAAPSPAPSPPEVRFERAIQVPGPGRVAVRLDARVYESARPDLADLRVVDDHGGLVPFLLDRGEAEGAGLDLRPAIRNRAWLRDGSASAILDFGDRVSRRRLRLELSGGNFRRRVAVEGSDEERRWKTIVDEAWVFAVPGTAPARYETIELPENDFRLLRVIVHPGPDERERIVIRDASLPAQGSPPRREQRLEPPWRRVEDVSSAETWVVLQLGARYRPFDAITLSVPEPRFFREVLVEARRERPTRKGTPGGFDWVGLGRGAVYRLEHAGRQSDQLRIRVSGRERTLRLRLLNHDDRPLTIRGVLVWAPIEQVVFEATAGRSYALRYGTRGLGPPCFDLARTVSDPATFAAGASLGSLGGERAARPPERPQPWTERHPTLLWLGLVAVVVVLGALTYRALARAP